MTLRRKLPSLAAFTLLCTTAFPCGPDFPEAVFVRQSHPGAPYSSFVAGHLGVPQPGYLTRDLVTIYNYLTERPLTSEQQAATLTVDHFVTQDWSDRDKETKDAGPSALEQWTTARAAVKAVPVDPNLKLDADRYIADYQSFPNCLDDSFITAKRTLEARTNSYGATSAAVAEWVRGQDSVFSNCSAGHTNPYFGPGDPPPPPTKPSLPGAAPANAPLWLQQDRAYQIAAANFYATNYDEAIKGFRSIAADTKSPWSDVSRYLIARALVRKATVFNGQLTDPSGNEVQKKSANDSMSHSLSLARQELLAMQSDPHMASMQHAVSALLDYVNIRYAPSQQAAVLTQRLHSKDASNYGQSLLDLAYLRYTPYAGKRSLAPEAFQNDKTNMLLWLDVFSSSDETRALHQWHATPSTVWLLAAISFAKPNDPYASVLIQAARNVPHDNPAWTAITYHRLRLMPHDEATRKELLAVLPEIAKNESVSTTNLFASLNLATAPALESWLSSAARYEAAETDMDGESAIDDTNPVDGACGDKSLRSHIALFDLDAAFVLNNSMPLTTLATVAESNTLPQNLRYQVAQATWARAVMLDRPEIAHRMSPLLIACRAAWKPVLDTYDHSTTPSDRKANGLLAMMRFASVEPSVRTGEERRNGFATYDDLRQNWWCRVVPSIKNNSVDDRSIDTGEDNFNTPPNPVQPVAPLFLTEPERSAAKEEVATLTRIPSASEYFTAEALAWQKEHPADPRTPDILGEAFRVERNSCESDNASALVHQVFDVLNRQYPHSSWTKKYTTWK